MSLRKDLHGIYNVDDAVEKLETLLTAEEIDGVKQQLWVSDELYSFRSDNLVEEIIQEWVNHENPRIQAYAAFKANHKIRQLNYKLIPLLPDTLLIKWKGFKQSLSTDGLGILKDFKQPQSREAVTPCLIHFLLRRCDAHMERNSVINLGYIFIEDKSKSLGQSLEVICSIIDFGNGRKEALRHLQTKKDIIDKSRQVFKLGDIPDDWVEEIVKTSIKSTPLKG